MKLQFAILCKLGVLAGCGTVLPERVEVPVPVSCVKARPERPTFATDQLKPGASVHEKTKAVLAERHQLRGYVGELEAVVTACEGVSR